MVIVTFPTKMNFFVFKVISNRRTLARITLQFRQYKNTVHTMLHNLTNTRTHHNRFKLIPVNKISQQISFQENKNEKWKSYRCGTWDASTHGDSRDYNFQQSTEI